jgi:hypothetical protein
VPNPEKQDFSLKLTRVIEPKEGPGVELATLEDAARLMGHMRPWRQVRPHWDYAAAGARRRDHGRRGTGHYDPKLADILIARTARSQNGQQRSQCALSFFGRCAAMTGRNGSKEIKEARQNGFGERLCGSAD